VPRGRVLPARRHDDALGLPAGLLQRHGRPAALLHVRPGLHLPRLRAHPARDLPAGLRVGPARGPTTGAT
jgi:hypothetical protein